GALAVLDAADVGVPDAGPCDLLLAQPALAAQPRDPLPDRLRALAHLPVAFLQRWLGQALPSRSRKAGTISRRLGTPSVRRRLSQCARTVRGAMPSSAAISAVLKPRSRA